MFTASGGLVTAVGCPVLADSYNKQVTLYQVPLFKRVNGKLNGNAGICRTQKTDFG